MKRPQDLTGIQEKKALVRAGQEALIVREAGKRVAALGGTEPKILPLDPAKAYPLCVTGRGECPRRIPADPTYIWRVAQSGCPSPQARKTGSTPTV
jgi:hypothetical protein